MARSGLQRFVGNTEEVGRTIYNPVRLWSSHSLRN